MKTGEAYRISIERWRKSQDQKFRAENGWLALAGLFWFHDGENTFGSGITNDIVLSSEGFPEVAGRFLLTDGEVNLEIDPSTGIEVDGRSVARATLFPDTSGKAQLVTVNNLAMTVIERDGKFGLRVWDNGRSERVNFPGKQWYPVAEAYRVEALYEPYAAPYTLRLERSNGSMLKTHVDGVVEFKLAGSSHQLIALTEEDGSLFLIFKDLTSGSTTYPGGRYLTAKSPDNDGKVIVDFNRAYHPPCAFTPYATCALPPAENALKLKIEAGERMRSIAKE